MGEPAKRRATFEDLLAAPSHLVAEIIHGARVTQPPPATDRAEKLPICAREGIAHVGLVDPATRTLEGFRPAGNHGSLLGAWNDEAMVRVEPLDALELELVGLWAR